MRMGSIMLFLTKNFITHFEKLIENISSIIEYTFIKNVVLNKKITKNWNNVTLSVLDGYAS